MDIDWVKSKKIFEYQRRVYIYIYIYIFFEEKTHYFFFYSREIDQKSILIFDQLFKCRDVIQLTAGKWRETMVGEEEEKATKKQKNCRSSE